MSAFLLIVTGSGNMTIIGLVAVLAVVHSVIASSWQATYPELVETAQLGSVLGLSQAGGTLATSLAPGVAGLLVGALGFDAVLAAVAVSYLLVGVLSATAVMDRRSAAQATERPDRRWQAGLIYLGTNPRARDMVAILTAFALFVGATNVVEVFLLRGVLGATSLAFGLIAMLWALGVVLGARLPSARGGTLPPHPVAVAGALLTALSLLLVGLSPFLAAAAVGLLMAGVGNGVLNVSAATAVMANCPRSMRGRVSTALSAVANTSMIASLGVGGLAAAWLGPRAMYVSAGACSALLVLAVGAGLMMSERRAASRTQDSGAGAPRVGRKAHTESGSGCAVIGNCGDSD